MPTDSPSYSAPDRSRQRIRLIAAIGLLATTAIAIGGTVALLSAEDSDAAPTAVGNATRAAEPGSTRTGRDSLNPLDSIDALIFEVEQAERAASTARAALRRARMLGNVDAEQLDWLERRLDALGRPHSLPSPGLAPPTDARAPASMPGSSESPREL